MSGLIGVDNQVKSGQFTFPSGHVIQTVHASFDGTTTSDSSSGSSYDGTHLTKDIVIQPGNSVKWTFQFGMRVWAGLSAPDYMFAGLYVYHKVDGGSFSNAYSKYIADWYRDGDGNLTYLYNKDETSCQLTGIHTPSSGTHHHYKLYYQWSVGGTLTIGVDTNQQQQFVILEEIQT